MKKLNFYYLINKTYINIEKKTELYTKKIDIDILIEQDILNITFPNKKKIIFYSKEYLKQLWMATQTHGYQFQYIKKKWICIRTKKELFTTLNEEILKQIKKDNKLKKNYFKK